MLTGLEELTIENQGVGGQVDKLFVNMPNLRILNMPGNQLTGMLSENISLENPRLEVILLGDNTMSGSIPDTIIGLQDLRALDLSANKVSGVINPDIGNLPKLTSLSLHENDLQGEIPLSLYNERIMTLRLGDNDLEGKIRDEVNNMVSLKNIYLGDTKMGGIVPVGLFGLPKIEEIHLQNAAFSGELWGEFAKLSPTLMELFLQNNNFSGEIPDTLLQSQRLTKLDLTGNPEITGSIKSGSQLCKRRNYNTVGVSVLNVDCTVVCECCGFRDECQNA